MVRNGECSPSSEMTPVTGWKKEDELLYKAREVAKQESEFTILVMNGLTFRETEP